MPEQAKYTHGHHSSVVNSHARRTVSNSAAFLLSHIKPHFRILDLGCGPGSITTGLAKLVPDGSVVGGDVVESVLSQARNHAADEGLTNLTFQVVDGNSLPFPDGEFDVAFCHQVVQHVHDPAGILREMRRVVKPGGIVAAREADYQSFVWYPESEGLTLWGRTYQLAHRAGGSEPNAGRFLRAWTRKAGFESEDVEFSWDTWNYQGEDAVFWGQSWKDRALYSNFAKTAVECGAATQEDLETISKAWDDWSREEDRFVLIGNGQVLCRVR